MTDEKKEPALPPLPTSLPTALPAEAPTVAAGEAPPLEAPAIDPDAAQAAAVAAEQKKVAAEMTSAITDVMAMAGQLPDAIALLKAAAAALGA